ncbi:11773_t:CDS:2 [Diversispora eburnea]|uniref:Lysophospholipase n=1 Tax=Diversispora eburnea TaxID=1213867 RepID=A0A9N9G6K4_9GLOM|nr:11773_t:CDS:2 [Diversispora eburnea]
MSQTATTKRTSWFETIKDALVNTFQKTNTDVREVLQTAAKRVEDIKIDDVILAFKDLNDIVLPRASIEICEQELKFIKDRRQIIHENFAKYVGVDVSEIHEDDIPVMAFMGSGGGFRAMIGLSGGSLCLAQLFSSRCQSTENPLQTLLEFYRTKLSSSIINAHGILQGLADTTNQKLAVGLSFGSLIQKKASGVELSIMDIFGALLAAKLMVRTDPTNQLGDFKLSEQQKYIEGGKSPMPLYVAVSHIRPWKDILEPEEAALIPDYDQVYEAHIKKKDYYQWYEFSPYEIGSDELPAWIPSWAFGRKFKSGKTVERFPEQNFCLLMGLFGSAPAAPFIEDLKEIAVFLPEGKIKEHFKSAYENVHQNQQVVEGSHPIPPPHNHNFAYRVKPPPYKLGHTNNEVLDLLDAGLSNDFPMYPISHPSRKVDLVIGFDCSASVIDHSNFDTAQDAFCTRRGFKRTTRDETNKYCEVFDYIPVGKTDDEYLTPAQKQFVFCLLQYVHNDKVDPNFEPAIADFATLNKFAYTTENVDLMIKLAKQNWKDGEEKVKEIVIDTWKKKKEARLNGTVFP